jgi:hypothetical protein
MKAVLKKASRRKLGSRGQFTIEAVLILSVLVSISLAVSRTSISEGWMKNLVEGPWLTVRGMIEDGVWVKAGASKAHHPHIKSRHGTYLGDQAQ